MLATNFRYEINSGKFALKYLQGESFFIQLKIVTIDNIVYKYIRVQLLKYDFCGCGYNNKF